MSLKEQLEKVEQEMKKNEEKRKAEKTFGGN